MQPSGCGRQDPSTWAPGAAALAAWVARRFSPYAEGSAIPEVEVALRFLFSAACSPLPGMEYVLN
jgi:H+/Cl- antiporter ClcA